MFLVLLGALVVAATVHAVRRDETGLPVWSETLLRYLVVGYCGLPMVVVSVGLVAAPERAAELLGFQPGSPFQGFLGYAYLGLSLSAVLALRYRGVYLVGPAVSWAVFFAGATVVHLRDSAGRGVLTHGGVLEIFATHGMVSVLLVFALATSGILKARE